MNVSTLSYLNVIIYVNVYINHLSLSPLSLHWIKFEKICFSKIPFTEFSLSLSTVQVQQLNQVYSIIRVLSLECHIDWRTLEIPVQQMSPLSNESNWISCWCLFIVFLSEKKKEISILKVYRSHMWTVSIRLFFIRQFYCETSTEKKYLFLKRYHRHHHHHHHEPCIGTRVHLLDTSSCRLFVDMIAENYPRMSVQSHSLDDDCLELRESQFTDTTTVWWWPINPETIKWSVKWINVLLIVIHCVAVHRGNDHLIYSLSYCAW